MAETLGICVTTRNCFKHLFEISKAAQRADKKVEIFFTGEGVHLSQHPDFNKLMDFGSLAICEVSFIAQQYEKEKIIGLKDKDFVTQARNAEMVEECTRYLVL